MHRGEIWWADIPPPIGRRPVLILTRDRVVAVRNALTVALVTRTIRDLGVEVRLDEKDDMPTACVVNLDSIHTFPKSFFSDYITTLSDEQMTRVEGAICYALDMKEG